jgi:CheY-like chemotaxis protein
MGRSILVADGSATLRKVVELAFEKTPFRVESVTSGHEALERLGAFHPDLVIADVAMPEPSGYEICRHVKESGRPVPVLLLAGAFEPFEDDRARECGADGILLKPFESRVLLERVEDLLSAEPAVRRDVREEPSPSPEEADPRVDSGMEQQAGQRAALLSKGGPAAEEDRGRIAVDDGVGLSEESIDALAEAVARRISAKFVREVAREVVPGVVEEVIRQRTQQGGDEGA